MYKKIKCQRILKATFIFALLLIGVFMLMKHFEEKSYFDYTEEDVKMLGDFMQAELCSYNKIGEHWWKNEDYKDIEKVYMLTGSVMLHRLESRLWGETLKEVIYAPGQYCIAWHDSMNDVNTPPEVYEWAEKLLKCGPLGPEGLIFESCFKQGNDTYWELNGKIYFSVNDSITKKVKGGKVN